MHQEYIQETPDANAPELLDRPYFEPQYELNEVIEDSSSDIATQSEVDDTIEEIVLDGGKELSIKDRVTFIVHDTMNNVDREGETVYLERKSDYLLFLAFKAQKTLTGSYSNNYGKIDLEVKTKLLKQKENSLEIEYTLINNKQKISDFKFILEYSIDT